MTAISEVTQVAHLGHRHQAGLEVVRRLHGHHSVHRPVTVDRGEEGEDWEEEEEEEASLLCQSQRGNAACHSFFSDDCSINTVFVRHHCVLLSSSFRSARSLFSTLDSVERTDRRTKKAVRQMVAAVTSWVRVVMDASPCGTGSLKYGAREALSGGAIGASNRCFRASVEAGRGGLSDSCAHCLLRMESGSRGQGLSS